MNIKDMNDLMTQINEKYKHTQRLEKAMPSLAGKDADRAVKTISNLRQQIVELERML